MHASFAIPNLIFSTLQKDLLLKLSTLETENKDNTEKLQAEILKRADKIEILQKEGEKDKQHVDSLENQVSQLQNILQEKEQLILQYKDRVKQLEVQNIEVYQTVGWIIWMDLSFPIAGLRKIQYVIAESGIARCC